MRHVRRVRDGRVTVFALALVGGVGLASAGCAPDESAGDPGAGTGGATGSGGVSATGGAGTGPVGPGTGGSITGATGGTGAGGNTSGSGGAPASTGGRGGASTASGGAVGTGGRGAAGNGAGGSGGVTGGGGVAGSAAGEVPLDASLLSRCTGTNPIRCTIPVPANGDYVVTVELGNAATASASRVQAELFRVVVPQVALPAGMFSRQTFAVNVRAETHDGYSAPGLVLDLRIDGPTPALHGLGFAAAPTLPTIFLAGDSTVCDWDPVATNILDPLQRGWAQELSQYLTPGIAVANYADSGETASSFYSKFFGPARTAMRAGDYLFIQFGHNDQKVAADVTNYQANLMRYITDARAKNATPVLFTPVARRTASATDAGFEGLDQQARALAAAQNVALIDLTTLAIAYYRTVPNVAALFATPSEGTHFSETGATQIANLVAQALKAGTLPLRTFVK